MTFNPNLTQLDKALTKAFMASLQEEHSVHWSKIYWTSDDFRRYGLDKYWSEKERKTAIGAYFARLKWHGHIVQAGEEASQIVSNNKRKNDLCRFHPRVEGWIEQKPINAYGGNKKSVLT